MIDKLQDWLRKLASSGGPHGCSHNFEVEFREIADHIDKLETENERLRTAQGWQPIETAPKDGTTVVLLFDKPVIAWWEADDGDPYVGEPSCHWWWDDGYTGRCEDGSQPTHWMPLPAPPAAKDQTAMTDSLKDRLEAAAEQGWHRKTFKDAKDHIDKMEARCEAYKGQAKNAALKLDQLEAANKELGEALDALSIRTDDHFKGIYAWKEQIDAHTILAKHRSTL